MKKQVLNNQRAWYFIVFLTWLHITVVLTSMFFLFLTRYIQVWWSHLVLFTMCSTLSTSLFTLGTSVSSLHQHSGDWVGVARLTDWFNRKWISVMTCIWLWNYRLITRFVWLQWLGTLLRNLCKIFRLLWRKKCLSCLEIFPFFFQWLHVHCHVPVYQRDLEHQSRTFCSWFHSHRPRIHFSFGGW